MLSSGVGYSAARHLVQRPAWALFPFSEVLVTPGWVGSLEPQVGVVRRSLPFLVKSVYMLAFTTEKKISIGTSRTFSSEVQTTAPSPQVTQVIFRHGNGTIKYLLVEEQLLRILTMGPSGRKASVILHSMHQPNQYAQQVIFF